jgi:predicted phosphodiesterase
MSRKSRNSSSIIKQLRPRLTKAQAEFVHESKSADNVLVIGDLHAPFTREGYLDHCKRVQDTFFCNKVIFIGDVIDSHYSSYHESDPDGMGAGDELEQAIKMLRPFYQAFPEAIVTIGNHDAIVSRKAFTAGLSKRWIRDYHEVLETPGWKFVEDYEMDNVHYVHGTGQSSQRAAVLTSQSRAQSTVMGHVHSASGVWWSATNQYLIFGMHVGCGVDQKSYAMAYSRTFRHKFIISNGVILHNGKVPLVVPMHLS